MALWAVALAWGTNGMAAPPDYEVDGVFEQAILTEPRVYVKGEFKVFVGGRGWLIRTVEDRGGDTVLMREVGSANGAEIVEVAMPLQRPSPAVTDANQASNRPGAPTPSPFATAIISSNSVPVGQLDGSVVGHLWLMFASGQYLKEMTTNRLTPVYDVSASAPGNPNLKLRAAWELVSGPGSLPANVTYFDNGGAVSALYTATGVASAGGATCPAGFTVKCYSGASVRKQATVSVRDFRQGCSLANFLPSITRRTLVVDRRFAQDREPIKAISYSIVAGGAWKSTAEIKNSYAGRNRATKTPPLMVLTMAVLTSAPFVVCGVRIWRRRRKRHA
jgi:hypothetical protein